MIEEIKSLDKTKMFPPKKKKSLFMKMLILLGYEKR